MKTIVLGASGQVGRALVSALGDRALALSRQDADLDRPEALAGALDRIAGSERVAAVINAAAYTAVDQAESDEARARIANGESPGALARWCARRGVPFVHYSTDYVFSGEGERPWSEEDPILPLNAYGRSKAEGERLIAEAGGRYLIFRTSWVYDRAGKNFVSTMLRLGRERETLRVVADQHGAPTYAPHLAAATLEALGKALAKPSFPAGIYHLCGQGTTTWHGFAEAIFERARALGVPLRLKSVEAIRSSEFQTPARRPLNSRLDQEKARKVLGVKLPGWQSALQECLLGSV